MECGLLLASLFSLVLLVLDARCWLVGCCAIGKIAASLSGMEVFVVGVH